MNESAPTSLTMAFDTIAFMPWISETTVTIDVTATMLPSTVMNDRSLLAQMACSAIAMDSRIWFMRRLPLVGRGLPLAVVGSAASLTVAAVGELADRIERAR